MTRRWSTADVADLLGVDLAELRKALAQHELTPPEKAAGRYFWTVFGIHRASWILRRKSARDVLGFCSKCGTELPLREMGLCHGEGHCVECLRELRGDGEDEGGGATPPRRLRRAPLGYVRCAACGRRETWEDACRLYDGIVCDKCAVRADAILRPSPERGVRDAH